MPCVTLRLCLRDISSGSRSFLLRNFSDLSLTMEDVSIFVSNYQMHNRTSIFVAISFFFLIIIFLNSNYNNYFFRLVLEIFFKKIKVLQHEAV